MVAMGMNEWFYEKFNLVKLKIIRLINLSVAGILPVTLVISAFLPLIPRVASAETLGNITTYHIGSLHPYGITQGMDGNMWYTTDTTTKIGKITPSGSYTEYSVPGGGSAPQPNYITIGPNGNP
jgi:streptogramin lyase